MILRGFSCCIALDNAIASIDNISSGDMDDNDDHNEDDDDEDDDGTAVVPPIVVVDVVVFFIAPKLFLL